MRKSIVFCCLVILLLAMSVRADAANPGEASSVGEFLADCQQDRTECDNFEAAIAVTMGSEEPAPFCLPAPTPDSVWKSIFDWLVAHSETHSMSWADGVYLAMKTLYPCKK
jgi:hypothetical protein